MTSILQEIVTLMVSGITQFGTGIGAGLKALVESIFLDQTGASPVLSTFGGLIVVFAGISLAVGLCRWIVNWLTSLGN